MYGMTSMRAIQVQQRRATATESEPERSQTKKKMQVSERASEWVIKPLRTVRGGPEEWMDGCAWLDGWRAMYVVRMMLTVICKRATGNEKQQKQRGKRKEKKKKERQMRTWWYQKAFSQCRMRGYMYTKQLKKKIRENKKKAFGIYFIRRPSFLLRLNPLVHRH